MLAAPRWSVVLLIMLSACALPQTTSEIAEDVDVGFDDPRRSPEQAVPGFEVADGLDVTLFASEPLFVNPTNMDIDAQGRVWICEARNYRPDYNPHHPVDEAGDRILILEDTDGDGQADTRTVFYQGPEINAALGIMVMGNQAIVSISPNIFLFTDDDGDLQADRKEVLFTSEGGIQDDHGLHAFTFGPDGRFYFNSGNGNKRLMHPDGTPLIDLAGNHVSGDRDPYQQGMVFRTNLDRSGFEVLGHNFRNNYEVAVDAYGTLWQSDNDDDGNRGVRINYVMEYGNYGYRDEMTGASWQTPRTGMEADTPERHWHLNDPGVVPNLLQTGAGSPTGILIYEGRLLPEVFWDEMIHADAGPNVVRAYPVTDAGAGYAATIENIVVSHTDQWFRPADVTVAPDGSLFIADWYDATVGGNQAVDQERGRIFRVAPPNTPYTVPPMNLDTPDGAVQALVSPNHARRYLAWNRLHDWQAEAEPALLDLWENADNPRHRARALWLLGQIEGRTTHYVDEALRDTDANVRIVGLRLARQQKLDPLPYIQEAIEDDSPQVRREALLALRHQTAPEAAALWTAFANHYDGNDRWYLEALGIAADRQWDRFFAAWRASVGDEWQTPAGRDIVWRARADAALPLLVDLIRSPDTDATERLRYFRALDFHGDANKPALLARFTDAPDVQVILALKHLGTPEQKGSPAFDATLERALTATAGTQAYLDLVNQFDIEADTDMLRRMAFDMPDSSFAIAAARLYLGQEGPGEIRAILDTKPNSDLIAQLGRIDSREAHDILESIILDESRDLTERRDATSALGGNWNGEQRLLALVEADRIPETLKPTAASRLLNVWRADIRKAAEVALGIPPDADAEPLPPIRSLVASVGNPQDGQVVFNRLCSTCHQVNGEGIEYGPDLTTIGDKLSQHALYTAILYPDAGITFGYAGTQITSSDGQQALGYVYNETDASLAIRAIGGEVITFNKTDITERTDLTNSLMPPLARSMSREELVDVVAFLHGLKAPQ